MGIKTDWWKHLPKEKQAERKEIVEKSKLMREATRDVLKFKLQEAQASAITKSNYDSPSWPYLQADAVGYARAVQEMIDLLTIED